MLRSVGVWCALCFLASGCSLKPAMVKVGAGEVGEVGEASSPVAAAMSGNLSVSTNAAMDASVFARVGDRQITVKQYEYALRTAGRQRYYHGTPPAEARQQWRQAVGEGVIEWALLVAEAKRRSIQPRPAEVDASLARVEKKLSKGVAWEKQRGAMMPRLRELAVEEDIIKQLEQTFRDGAVPSDADARAYFLANPDKFMQEEEIKLSVILLGVPTGSSSELWQQREQEASEIRVKVLAGADFQEIAKNRSDHESSTHGGDLGYVSANVLNETVRKQVLALRVGEISDVQRVGEGYGLYLMTDRRLPTVKPYETVAEDVKRMVVGEAWKNFKQSLRSSIPVQVNEALYKGDEELAADAQAEGEAVPGDEQGTEPAVGAPMKDDADKP